MAVGCSLVIGEGKSNDDPIRGFVSMEPYEIRLEAIVEVSAFREAWRIESDSISAGSRSGILENITTLFSSGVLMRIPGQSLDFSKSTVRFIQQDPDVGFVEDERAEIPLEDALVGITLSSGAKPTNEFSLEWIWFAPGQERLIVEVASGGKPSARILTPAQNSFLWKSEEELRAPEMLGVPAVSWSETKPLAYGWIPGGLLLLAAPVLILFYRQKAPSWVGWLIVIGLTLVVASFRMTRSEWDFPAATERDSIAYATLRNLYHAFDFREEEKIYDALEKTISGPLLEEIYLEVRNSLELEAVGGPRVRIYEVALREAVAESDEGEENLRLKVEWATIGEVTHWGHTHERTNRYAALMTLFPDEQKWKVINLDLQNEERIQKVSRRQVVPELTPSAASPNGQESSKGDREPRQTDRP
ncbi:MAG: hypothetical protein AAGC68_03770 [Verrucomicrobiota bacterium]